MKIYTKTGDRGDTGLFGGPRVAKDAPRIEAYGAVDELNSALGVARSQGFPPETDSLLARIQNDLFSVGAELATPSAGGRPTPHVADSDIAALEQAGGCAAAAQLHLARTVCRRAERRLVTLMRQPDEHVASEPLIYLNRLSDLLFVLARVANKTAGVPDVPWQKPG
jgi:cob(I)alamin adenosyltransferase